MGVAFQGVLRLRNSSVLDNTMDASNPVVRELDLTVAPGVQGWDPQMAAAIRSLPLSETFNLKLFSQLVNGSSSGLT